MYTYNTLFFLFCVDTRLFLLLRFMATQQIAWRSPPFLNTGANRGVSHMAVEAEIGSILDGDQVRRESTERQRRIERHRETLRDRERQRTRQRETREDRDRKEE